MKSTIHGVRSFDRSPAMLFKTFLVDWCDFIQQNCFNLAQIHSRGHWEFRSAEETDFRRGAAPVCAVKLPPARQKK